MTDDDVLVSPNWISAKVAAFRAYLEAAIFCSDITPWLEGQTPSWLMDNWQSTKNAYAVRELGNTSEPMTEFMLPYGADFAIRVRELRRHAIDPSLGIKGIQTTGGDETILITLTARRAAGGPMIWNAGFNSRSRTGRVKRLTLCEPVRHSRTPERELHGIHEH